MFARTKAHPCDYVNRGLSDKDIIGLVSLLITAPDTNCPSGNKCIYAHKCKSGRNCLYYRRGTCKFEGGECSRTVCDYGN